MAKVLEERSVIVSNVKVGPELFVMTLHCPEIACSVLPGQFVHLQVPDMEGHILRRPFSVYGAPKMSGTIDILYRTVGFGSTRMTDLAAGREVSLVGPVGRGWEVPEGAKRVLLVGGGVGAAPLYLLCEQCVERGIGVTVVLGATTHNMLVCEKRYADLLGSLPRSATDDGSYGHPGFCTGLVDDALQKEDYDWVACCGPTPLMRLVAKSAAAAGVACSVSMEQHMACGIGACLGCIVNTVDGNKRSCVDGPVFDAEKVVW